MIVKVQQSLSSTEKEPSMLIYNKDRKYTYQGPLTPEVELILDGRPKIYCEGRLNGSVIEIIKEVQSQNW